MKITIWSNDG